MTPKQREQLIEKYTDEALDGGRRSDVKHAMGMLIDELTRSPERTELEKTAIDNMHFPLVYDEMGQMIFGKSLKGGSEHILDVRGWGRLQYLDNSMKIQDTIGKLVVDTLNKHLGNGN